MKAAWKYAEKSWSSWTEDEFSENLWILSDAIQWEEEAFEAGFRYAIRRLRRSKVESKWCSPIANQIAADFLQQELKPKARK